MKVQDLFIIFLKLLGIYIIVVNLQSILSYIPLMALDDGYSTLLYTLAALLGVVFIVFILFKYSDVILKFVIPEKGLESTTIDFGAISKESLFEIGIVLMSLYLIINNLQTLILQGLYFFKSKVAYRDITSVFENTYNIESLQYASVSVILGLVLIATRKYISKLF
ncbi:hypothetical protein ACFO3O_04080 [Dokdonia ponticola]|uniref:DUF2975 domain-containing protein n=1 Tax=Dokdonia ponticola TaxID=2041041 RepID=A0ABV9HSZ5_9FLAO